MYIHVPLAEMWLFISRLTFQFVKHLLLGLGHILVNLMPSQMQVVYVAGILIGTPTSIKSETGCVTLWSCDAHKTQTAKNGYPIWAPYAVLGISTVLWLADVRSVVLFVVYVSQSQRILAYLTHIRHNLTVYECAISVAVVHQCAVSVAVNLYTSVL